MKRIKLFLALVVIALGLASCGDTDDYMAFVGTWGVEEIEYYNIDYWGNPIQNTIKKYHFTPGDPQDGIDLIFRADRSGEMRDRSRDTLYLTDSTYILCPDTTLVTKFTYSYHKDDATLYMNMQVAHPFTYQMDIPEFTDNSFVYINEYDNDYVEKAWLKRISDAERSKSTRGSKSVYRPRMKGSLLSN